MTTNTEGADDFLERLLAAYRDVPQLDLPIGELLLDLKTFAWPGTWAIDVEKAFVIGYRQGVLDTKKNRPEETSTPFHLEDHLKTN